MRIEKGATTTLEWGIASRSLPGQSAMGDVGCVLPTPQGALIGVIDGLGHGPEAASAAAVSLRTLQEFLGRPVTDLLELCHESLRRTRGVVMSLAAFDAIRPALTWAGVGNVEAILAHEDYTAGFEPKNLMPQPGIVGHRLPQLHPVTLPLEPGLTAVLATDGIDMAFMREFRPVGSPDRIAERIVEKHARPTDDALVLVARYVGGTD